MTRMQGTCSVYPLPMGQIIAIGKRRITLVSKQSGQVPIRRHDPPMREIIQQKKGTSFWTYSKSGLTKGGKYMLTNV